MMRSGWCINAEYADELQSFLVEVEGMEGLVEGLQASFLDVIDEIKGD